MVQAASMFYWSTIQGDAVDSNNIITREIASPSYLDSIGITCIPAPYFSRWGMSNDSVPWTHHVNTIALIQWIIVSNLHTSALLYQHCTCTDIGWAWFMQDLTTKILSVKFVSKQNLAILGYIVLIN